MCEKYRVGQKELGYGGRTNFRENFLRGETAQCPRNEIS